MVASKRKYRTASIIGVAVGLGFLALVVTAMAIHSTMLSTDRFNWLEEPKR